MKYYKTRYCCTPDYKIVWHKNGKEYYAVQRNDCGAFGQKWYESEPFQIEWLTAPGILTNANLPEDLPEAIAKSVFPFCKKCGEVIWTADFCDSCMSKIEKVANTDNNLMRLSKYSGWIALDEFIWHRDKLIGTMTDEQIEKFVLDYRTPPPSRDGLRQTSE